MKRWKGLLLGLIIILPSCSTETSVLTDNSISIESTFGETRYVSPEKISYASTISNLISTFPKFRNQALNSEITSLKKNLTDYLNALQVYKNEGRNTAAKDFEKNYKNIQKLRKFLNPEDDQVLNRYLVKLKTNMNLLEAIEGKESRDIITSN